MAKGDRNAKPYLEGSRPTFGALGAFAITPADTTDLEEETRGLYVAVAGAVKVEMANGSVVTFTNLVAGVVHPLRVAIVWSTGTTATGIVGLY